MSVLKNSKPKLVVLLSRFPYPLEKGDKLRAYHQIKELSENFEITLISITDKKIENSSFKKLQIYCSDIHIIRLSKWSILSNLLLCLFNKKPFQVGYFYTYFGKLKIQQLLKTVKPEYIYCQLIRTSEYIKDYHHCPKTIDYMDALSKGIERRISGSPWYLKWLFKIETRRLKNYERIIFDYFEHKTIISEQDRDLITHPDRKKIICIPNGIDLKFFEPVETNSTHDLVFVGNLSYAPNVEAVEFISKEILSKNSDLTCLISGATPHSTIQKISKANHQITLQGWVDDIRFAYKKGRIFVAPMMIGTGMQNKLLEAMALGIPCITTDLANNAIQAVNNESIIVANDGKQFIDAILKLKSDQQFYKKIALNGQLFVKSNYSWQISSSKLADLIMNKA